MHLTVDKTDQHITRTSGMCRRERQKESHVDYNECYNNVSKLKKSKGMSILQLVISFYRLLNVHHL